GNSTQSAGFAVANPFRGTPPYHRSRRGKVSGHKSAGREAPGSQSASSIEAEPSNPKQARANKTEHHAVRRHRMSRITYPTAKIKSAHQSGNSRGNVHNCSAGKIERGKASTK